MYPRININLEKLSHNAKYLINRFDYTEIMAVTKSFCADKVLVQTLLDSGIKHLADSRIQNIMFIKENFDVYTTMLRLPMLSEVENVVKYANCSINSELKTINALNLEAKKQDKIHDIFLAIDVGDLREGVMFNTDYLSIVKEIISLENINLIGISTNVTCYGAVLPTVENMHYLVDIKSNIKSSLNYELKYISGGNSSGYHLFNTDSISKEINSFRFGELIIKGTEASYGDSIPELEQDIFTISAEVIECKYKPSFPIGKTNINAFGESVSFVDVGMQNRVIVALGRQDVPHTALTPIDSKYTIIGASSDHLILTTDTNIEIGEVIEFTLDYSAILGAMTSKYVSKNYK